MCKRALAPPPGYEVYERGLRNREFDTGTFTRFDGLGLGLVAAMSEKCGLDLRLETTPVHPAGGGNMPMFHFQK